MTKAPLAKKLATQVTVTVFDVIDPTAVLMAACKVSVPVTLLL